MCRFVGVAPIAARLDVHAQLNTGESQRERTRRPNRIAKLGAAALRRSGLRSLLPADVRGRGYRATTRSVLTDEMLALPDDLRRDVLQRLRDDIAELETIAPGVTKRWSP